MSSVTLEIVSPLLYKLLANDTDGSVCRRWEVLWMTDMLLHSLSSVFPSSNHILSCYTRESLHFPHNTFTISLSFLKEIYFTLLCYILWVKMHCNFPVTLACVAWFPTTAACVFIPAVVSLSNRHRQPHRALPQKRRGADTMWMSKCKGEGYKNSNVKFIVISAVFIISVKVYWKVLRKVDFFYFSDLLAVVVCKIFSVLSDSAVW